MTEPSPQPLCWVLIHSTYSLLVLSLRAGTINVFQRLFTLPMSQLLPDAKGHDNTSEPRECGLSPYFLCSEVISLRGNPVWRTTESHCPPASPHRLLYSRLRAFFLMSVMFFICKWIPNFLFSNVTFLTPPPSQLSVLLRPSFPVIQHEVPQHLLYSNEL